MSQQFGDVQIAPEPGRMSLAQEMLWSAVGGLCSPEQFAIAVEQMEGKGPKSARSVRRIPPDLVTAAQRVRLIVALMKAVAERDYFSVNVEAVTKGAHTGRNVFYRYFENIADCFLTAYEDSSTLLRGRIQTAISKASDDWEDRLRAGLVELVYFATYETAAARTLLAGREALCAAGQRDELLDHFARCLGVLIQEGAGTAPGRIVLSAAVGGIEQRPRSSLQKPEPGDLSHLVPELTAFIRMLVDTRQSS